MEKILKEILQELKNIHYHLDRFDVFYRMINKIKVEEKGEIRSVNTDGNKKEI